MKKLRPFRSGIAAASLTLALVASGCAGDTDVSGGGGGDAASGGSTQD